MRKFTVFLASGAIVIAAALTVCGAAPLDMVPDKRVVQIVRNFSSPDWKARESAFYALLDLGGFKGDSSRVPSALTNLLNARPEAAPSIKAALIDLLAKENSVQEEQKAEFQRTRRTVPEEYTNYYGDLIEAVSSLRDPHSVDALLGAINTGNMATRGLASLGRVALDPLITKLNAMDTGTRHSATRAIGQMLDYPSEIGDGDKERIKSALVGASSDENQFVRMSAVEGLAKLRDPSLAPVLNQIAEGDPYRTDEDAYPVREAARKALRQQVK